MDKAGCSAKRQKGAAMNKTCEACGEPAADLCPDGYDDDCCDAADHNHWEPGE